MVGLDVRLGCGGGVLVIGYDAGDQVSRFEECKENAERQVGKHPTFLQLQRMRRSWAGFRALVGTEPMGICGATHPS